MIPLALWYRNTTNPDPQIRQRGVTLLEYGVIGTSVVAVCIAAFIALGGNLNDWLTGLKENTQKQVETTSTKQVAITASKVAFEKAQAEAAMANVPNVSMTGLKSGSGSSLCSATWCIDAPGLTGNSVSTAGSNGNKMVQLTQSASGVFQQLATVLEQQNADPGLVALLTQMANQGHTLANNQSTFLTDGVEYDAMRSSMTDTKTGLATFKQLDQQLKSKLNQLPADSRGILIDASNVIIGVGESYSFNIPSDPMARVGWSYTSKNIQLVHSNSNTICSNGGDTSSCLQ